MTAEERTIDLLRVGAASVSITPADDVVLAGYNLRYAEGVSDPLLANALAVGSDHVAWLLLTVDAIGLDRSFTAGLRESLAGRLPLAPSAITIVCSHTHSGPATLNLGPVASDDSYLAFLEQRLLAVAETAADHLQPVRWRFGATLLAENVNRRVHRQGRVELGADPAGPADNRLRVIRIDPADGLHQGVPLAIVVHYACHATSSVGVPRVSADWPGAMRRILQRVYADDGVQPVVCFLQGCAGDLTHRIGRDRKAWLQHFGQHTPVQALIMGRLAAAAAVLASERATDFAAETVQSAVQPLELPFRDGLGAEETELQVVRIGPRPSRLDSAQEAMWLIGLPGEPFTRYSTDIGRLFHCQFGAQPDRVLVCGYTNDCIGYLCTADAVREGGYEAAGAHQVYYRPSPFAAAAEAIVLSRSLNVAELLAEDTPILRRVICTVLHKIIRLARRPGRWGRLALILLGRALARLLSWVRPSL